MPAWPKHKVSYWIGLVAIITLYCVYYLYFIYNLSREVSLRTMHLLKFLFVVVAYGIGVLGLRKNVLPGLMRLWQLVYVVCVLLLVLLGMYDWFVARAPLAVRGIADNIHELLVSPILYVAFSLISYRMEGRGDYRKGL